MKNALPRNGVRINEAAIINLGDETGSGTHWVAYGKAGQNVEYFDSFGNLKPPKGLVNYFKVDDVKYNYENYQNYNTFICGRLCLKFLSNNLI